MKLFTWKALFLMYKSFLWKFDCSLKNTIVAYGGPIWLMLSFARARRILFINFISHIILSIAMIIAIVTIIIISLTGTFTYHRQFRFLLIVSLPFMVTLKNVEFSYEEYEYSIIWKLEISCYNEFPFLLLSSTLFCCCFLFCLFISAKRALNLLLNKR